MVCLIQCDENTNREREAAQSHTAAAAKKTINIYSKYSLSGSISPSEGAGEEADWTFKAINSLIPSNRLLLSPQSPKQLRKSKMHIHHLILWCCKCEVLYLILLNSFKHFFPTTVKPKLGSNFEIILVPSCCCLNLPFSILMSVNCFFFP